MNQSCTYQNLAGIRIGEGSPVNSVLISKQRHSREFPWCVVVRRADHEKGTTKGFTSKRKAFAYAMEFGR